MKKISKLAIYDSGLGGFSIYHDLKERYPDLEMVLYADQKHAPYGNQSYENLLDLSINAIESISKDGFIDVLIACNTISATSLSTLKLMFPHMNIMGIIDLTVADVAQGSIAVLATQATTASKAYEIALADRGSVQGIALIDLVSHIEGLSDEDTIIDYLNSIDLLKEDYDTIILACTHYPLILNTFKKLYPSLIVDSREGIASMLKDNYKPSSNASFLKTSGDPQRLKEQVLALFKEDAEVQLWNL